jgi:HEAT repeat protein
MKRLAVLALGCFFLGLGFADAQTPKKSDVPKFIKQLSDKDAKMRLSGIKGIYEVGIIKAKNVAEAVEPLVGIVKKDPDAKCRAEAAVTLGAIDPEEPKGVVETLMTAMKEDKDAGVQTGCITGLGNLAGKAKAALPTLQEMNNEARVAVKKAKEELAAVKDDKEKAKLANAKFRTAQARAKALGAAVKNISAN